jgi:hypothetical protein
MLNMSSKRPLVATREATATSTPTIQRQTVDMHINFFAGIQYVPETSARWSNYGVHNPYTNYSGSRGHTG